MIIERSNKRLLLFSPSLMEKGRTRQNPWKVTAHVKSNPSGLPLRIVLISNCQWHLLFCI